MHASLIHSASSIFIGSHGFAPITLFEGTFSNWCRNIFPVPHTTLHSVHKVQSAWQSTGQIYTIKFSFFFYMVFFWVLTGRSVPVWQILVSVLIVGHAIPLFSGSVFVRVLSAFPATTASILLQSALQVHLKV